MHNLYVLLKWRSGRRYNLTLFAIQLNEITPGLAAKLAPTDCRLRPDQHCLELGEYDQVRAWPDSCLIWRGLDRMCLGRFAHFDGADYDLIKTRLIWQLFNCFRLPS